jgi:hypothetical protein
MLPASLASERLFRGSGRIVTTDRNSLATKTLEYLTQIKNNRVEKSSSLVCLFNNFFLNRK